MNTIRNLKKMRTSALGTAAAAAALPALLFVGAGTAQADANPSFGVRMISPLLTEVAGLTCS
jgi:hypothetical protein